MLYTILDLIVNNLILANLIFFSTVGAISLLVWKFVLSRPKKLKDQQISPAVLSSKEEVQPLNEPIELTPAQMVESAKQAVGKKRSFQLKKVRRYFSAPLLMCYLMFLTTLLSAVPGYRLYALIPFTTFLLLGLKLFYKWLTYESPYERVLVWGDNNQDNGRLGKYWDELPFDELRDNLDIRCRTVHQTNMPRFASALLVTLVALLCIAQTVAIQSSLTVLEAYFLFLFILTPFTAPLGWRIGKKLLPSAWWIVIPGKDEMVKGEGDKPILERRVSAYLHSGLGFTQWHSEEVDREAKQLVAAGMSENPAKQAVGAANKEMLKRRLGSPNWTSKSLAAMQKQEVFYARYAVALNSSGEKMLQVGSLAVIVICLGFVVFLSFSMLSG